MNVGVAEHTTFRYLSFAMSQSMTSVRHSFIKKSKKAVALHESRDGKGGGGGAGEPPRVVRASADATDALASSCTWSRVSA